MKKFSLYTLTLSLVAMLSGCSAYSLMYSEEAPGVNLANYPTFRIAVPQDGKLPEGMTEVTYYNVAAAIREQLVERGFVESAQASMVVNFGISVKTEETVVPYTNTMSTTVPTYGPALLPPPPPPVGNGVGPALPPPPPGQYYPGFIYPRTYYTTYTQWVPTTYEAGTLVMDLVDMPERKLLYTSSVATILDGSGRLQTLSGIAKAVQTLFSKFPVPMPKQ